MPKGLRLPPRRPLHSRDQLPLEMTPLPTATGPRSAVALWLLGLVALVCVAYHNSFSGPFVFDDAPAIIENASVHRLSLATLLPPPDEGQTVGGRPVVNLTLALNYALGGTRPPGYHVFNLLIHLGATCLLFGVVRRTLLLPRFGERFRRSASALAFNAAALWAVHPLLTEAVTYIVQRAESLAAFFYLLTLYAFVRAVEARRISPVAAGIWACGAFIACLLGMATKEAMVTAPVVVLLYDRIFVASSWRELRSQRWRWHAALFSTWILLAWLVHQTGGRGGTAGLGVGDSVWDYLLIQCRAIMRYLALALWPNALSFDYGMHQDTSVVAALPYGLALAALLGATGLSLWRWPALGFLGATFFLLLAPSSSFVPIAVQPIAEHRMYLPLAVVAVGVVVGTFTWCRHAPFVLGAATAALAVLTLTRNATYRSDVALWNDTIAKQPRNARAHVQLADALATSGRPEAALPYYRKAIELETAAVHPGDRTLLTEMFINLGNALLALGRPDDAIASYRRAIEHDALAKTAHYNLGSVLMESGHCDEAAAELETAIRLDPNYASAHTNLGSVRLQQRRPADALTAFVAAAQLDPSAKTCTNIGVALAELGRHDEAIAAFERALAFDPNFRPARELLDEARAKGQTEGKR